MAKAKITKPGLVWHEINDPEIIAQIKADKVAGLTYKELEVKYGLRQNNGMSAYNIVIGKAKPVGRKPKEKIEDPAEVSEASKKAAELEYAVAEEIAAEHANVTAC